MFRDLKDKLRLAQARTMFELQELLHGGSSETPARPLELYELEERVLLSATPVAIAAEAMNAAPTDDFASLTPSEPASAVDAAASAGDMTENAKPVDDAGAATEDQQTLEVVFIDTSVENYQQLVDDIINSEDPDRQFELVLLNQSSDGVDRISESLAKFDGVDAVHIVSHGTEGAVKLGNTWLTTDNLSGYAGEISQWGNSLSSSADILFYGCDLASNDAGRTLAEFDPLPIASTRLKRRSRLRRIGTRPQPSVTGLSVRRPTRCPPLSCRHSRATRRGVQSVRVRLWMS